VFDAAVEEEEEAIDDVVIEPMFIVVPISLIPLYYENLIFVKRCNLDRLFACACERHFSVGVFFRE